MDENNEELGFEPFEPYKGPGKVNMEIEKGREVFKIIYHGIGMAYWYIKRDRANDKMRKHGLYFEHEHEVTKFKRDLDET